MRARLPRLSRLIVLAVAVATTALSTQARAEPVAVPVYEFLWPADVVRQPTEPFIAELPHITGSPPALQKALAARYKAMEAYRLARTSAQAQARLQALRKVGDTLRTALAASGRPIDHYATALLLVEKTRAEHARGPGGDHAPAMVELDQAMTGDPSVVEQASSYKGYLQLLDGDFAGAVTSYQVALEAATSDSARRSARARVSIALLGAGRAAEAAALWPDGDEAKDADLVHHAPERVAVAFLNGQVELAARIIGLVNRHEQNTTHNWFWASSLSWPEWAAMMREAGHFIIEDLVIDKKLPPAVLDEVRRVHDGWDATHVAPTTGLGQLVAALRTCYVGLQRGRPNPVALSVSAAGTVVHPALTIVDATTNQPWPAADAMSTCVERAVATASDGPLDAAFRVYPAL